MGIQMKNIWTPFTTCGLQDFHIIYRKTTMARSGSRLIDCNERWRKVTKLVPILTTRTQLQQSRNEAEVVRIFYYGRIGRWIDKSKFFGFYEIVKLTIGVLDMEKLMNRLIVKRISHTHNYAKKKLS